VSPNLFKGTVGAVLIAIAVLAFAPWDHGSASATDMDLATANHALAAAAPGLGVTVSEEELSSPDYPPDDGSPGGYAPAPSYARGMTPEWHEFAGMVDRACAVSWNFMLAQRARAQKAAYEHLWTAEHASATVWKLNSSEDARILRATAILGQPPREQALFASWRANVATRTGLFRRASRAAAAGRFDLVQRICARITRLKAEADELGQRFGLRICTSN
jgi:hypothetical protein